MADWELSILVSLRGIVRPLLPLPLPSPSSFPSPLSFPVNDTPTDTTPKTDAIVFITTDIAALVVQAIGGAKASQAAQTGNGDPEVGGHIMLAGIVIQMSESSIVLPFLSQANKKSSGCNQQSP